MNLQKEEGKCPKSIIKICCTFGDGSVYQFFCHTLVKILKSIIKHLRAFIKTSRSSPKIVEIPANEYSFSYNF
jgi:hypothetical protein